ncbi:hypothetical protein ACFORH_39015 [Amycolatopsis roodepoortensis]|uniref:Uncharacterized protein n=1 Tax=Amycolatopsis roodepoortensis TaxID=700274 RepID=A0ABR9LII9_9PSEU|nr:hypothetical protein [Amycolatopsis roodepoortensis]MBE1580506.1 hypothetical protein [Amycolatopsis roodepoortensis]
MPQSRMQIEPTETLRLEPGRDGEATIVVLDEENNCTKVIVLSPQQLASLCEQASEQ